VVTRWLRGGYAVVTRWLHGGYTVVTPRVPLCARDRDVLVISERFACDLTVVTRWLHGGYTVVTS
jgi:hypothetical protein